MAEEKRGYWRYAWFSMAYYGANGAFQGFISRYYQAQGVRGGWLTGLLAAVPLVSLVMQPIWGLAGDRAADRTKMLRGLILGAAAGAVLLGLGKGWGWMLGCTCLFSALFTSVQPLGDAIVLEAAGRDFGRIRLGGCVAYAVLNVIFGLVMEGERIHLTPWITAGMLGLTLWAGGRLPESPGHQRGSGRKRDLRVLLGDRKLAGLLLMVAGLQVTLGYYFSFFPLYLGEMPGGGTALLGICYFVASLSEIPFLLCSRKLYGRLGASGLMRIAAACLGIRWLILWQIPRIWAAVASQILHGWGFIVITVSMAMYMEENVPEELKTSGQMLLAAAGYGAARTFGILGGGMVSRLAGGTGQGFGAMGALSALILAGSFYFGGRGMNALKGKF